MWPGVVTKRTTYFIFDVGPGARVGAGRFIKAAAEAPARATGARPRHLPRRGGRGKPEAVKALLKRKCRVDVVDSHGASH